MNPKNATLLLLIALALIAPLTALEPMPTFTVSANPNCNSASTFTCAATGNVIQNWQMPTGIDYHGCTLGTNCHFEYCIAANPPASLNAQGIIVNGYCDWDNAQPTYFRLNDTYGNNPYTVYGEYRLVVNATTYYYSMPNTSNVINLDETAPTVILNSPAGLANSDSYYTTGIQPQYVNGSAGQWITWSASTANANPSETVNTSIYGCAGSSCPLASNLVGPPFYWNWAASSPVSTYTFLQIKGIDQAGLGNRTTDTAQLFSIFDPTGGTATSVSCGPDNQNGTQPCLVLADGTPSSGATNDIPGDPPAGDSQGSDCNPQCLLFSGYTDVCMRADSAVNSSSNPYGTNVYLMYSYPVLNQSTVNNAGYNGTFYSQAVETHLASSDTGLSTSQPSGQSWCAGDASNCGTQQVLFPSLEVNTNPPTFSSHEVPNFLGGGQLSHEQHKYLVCCASGLLGSPAHQHSREHHELDQPWLPCSELGPGLAGQPRVAVASE